MPPVLAYRRELQTKQLIMSNLVARDPDILRQE
jgi:hypothetical protein